MIKHDDLIEEIRYIRRSIRQEFFDHPTDLIDSASTVLGDLLTQGVKKYFVAVFTTRSRIEALTPVKSDIDLQNGQNPVFILDEDATENDAIPEKIFWSVQNFKLHFTRIDNLMNVVNQFNNHFCPTKSPRSMTPKIDENCDSFISSLQTR